MEREVTLAIRQGTEADLEEILPIWRKLISRTRLVVEHDTGNLEDLRKQYKGVEAAGFPYFVTVKEGRVVGWCFFRRFSPVTDTAYRFSAVAESWVAPEAMNDGVGRLHQQTLLHSLKSLPIKELLIPMSTNYRSQLSLFGLDFPGSLEIGHLENICEKNGEIYSLYIRQLSTGWMPKL